MSISRHEAGEALDAMIAADQRVREFQGARAASPYLIFWGLVWLVCNGISGLAPRHAVTAWFVALTVGVLATVGMVIRQSRQRDAAHAYTAAERAALGRRAAIVGVAVAGFIPAASAVLAPLSPMQANAFISLFWAFVYMASGAWLGTRMFVAGLVTAAAVLAGYFLMPQHYFLWMAVVGGGSLILAGLWLRKL